MKGNFVGKGENGELLYISISCNIFNSGRLLQDLSNSGFFCKWLTKKGHLDEKNYHFSVDFLPHKGCFLGGVRSCHGVIEEKKLDSITNNLDF